VLVGYFPNKSISAASAILVSSSASNSLQAFLTPSEVGGLKASQFMGAMISRLLIWFRQIEQLFKRIFHQLDNGIGYLGNEVRRASGY
jgi:hypothetical protein